MFARAWLPPPKNLRELLTPRSTPVGCQPSGVPPSVATTIAYCSIATPVVRSSSRCTAIGRLLVISRRRRAYVPLLSISDARLRTSFRPSRTTSRRPTAGCYLKGYRAEKIASAGHSVGGNLAVSLCHRLRDHPTPLPAAILSISSWYDPELKSATYKTNAHTDKILSMALMEFFRESWLGGTGVAHNDPRVNLLYSDLSGLPPINIHYGAHELLVGEVLEFANRAKAASVNVTHHAVPEGQHLFLLGAGRVPETHAAIADMGRWLRSKLAAKH